MFLHLQKVITKVKDVKASVLPQQGDDHAAGPVEAVTEALPGKQEQGCQGCVNKDSAL